MARTAKTAGTEFLAELLAKLPESQRAKAQEAFASAEADAALIALGEGTLRQSDYSRVSNEVKTKEQEVDAWKGQLDTWFADKKAALEEADRLRANPNPNPNPNPIPPVQPLPPDLSKFVSPEQLAKTLEQTERGALVFITESNRLTAQHYKDFGEVLDLSPLLAHKRVMEVGLTEVYKELHKEQLDAKATAAEAARVAVIRDEERKKLQAEMAGTHQPYPVRGNEASTLDHIEATRAGQNPALKSVADMTAEYDRLNAVRTGV